jgi:bacillolysin
MVKGEAHPWGKTTIDVPAIVGGYDSLGSIFYQANTNCLTPGSNFAVAHWCTADVFGGRNKDNIHLA